MATIDGYDLRERPWQPGLDDARFNQQPRNPNFMGGASPEAAAYQRANDLRGMAATERPWTGADTKAFGNRPAGVPPSLGERLKGAADAARDGYARVVGDKTHFGPQQPAPAARTSAGGRLGALGGVASGALAALPELVQTAQVATDKDSSGIDVATQAAEGVSRVGLATAGAAAGAKAGLLAGGGLGPLGAGAGGLIGGALGGAVGYWGGEKGIPALRDLFGVTPESPIDRVRARQTAALNAPAPTTAPGGGHGATDPYAAATAAEKARIEAAQAVGADRRAQTDGAARPDLGYGPIGDRTALTNEQVSVMNPQGRVTAVRQPNGTLALSGGDVRGEVSYQDASGKPLPGGGLRGRFADFQVAPAGSTVVAGPNGSYATGAGGAGGAGGMTPSQAAQYNAEVERARAINADEAARNNSTAARMQRLADPFSNEGRALRNLRMDIDSSLDRKGRPTAATQALLGQYGASAGAYLGEPGQERIAAAERYKADQGLRGDMLRSEADAGARRYAADQSLRGDIFKSTASAAAQRATAEKDAEKYAAERRDKATERLDKVFSSYATVDGKVDEGRLAAMRNGAQAFLGTAIGEARKRGDTATVAALEKQGLTALADDPSLMQKYAAALKLDSEARRSGGSYVGTDNPGARTIKSVTPRNFLGLGGDVGLSDGTRVPRNRVEYDPRSGVLPNSLAHIDPWSNRTTEYDVLDPQGVLRKAAQ